MCTGRWWDEGDDCLEASRLVLSTRLSDIHAGYHFQRYPYDFQETSRQDWVTSAYAPIPGIVPLVMDASGLYE